MDLVVSSSTAPINLEDDNIPEILRSSSPIAYGSDDESELYRYQEHPLARAKEFRMAAEIFEKQATIRNPADNRIWKKSVVDRDVGKDVASLVQDIRRFEGAARTTDKTWANPKNKKEVRRMQNMMGYYVQG